MAALSAPLCGLDDSGLGPTASRTERVRPTVAGDRRDVARTPERGHDRGRGHPLLGDRSQYRSALGTWPAQLFYVECTGTALTGLRIFGSDEALTTYAAPVRFDSPRRQLAGIARAVAPPGRPMHRRTLQLARGMPRLVRAFPEVIATNCDVAQALVPRLGLPAGVAPLVACERSMGRKGLTGATTSHCRCAWRTWRRTQPFLPICWRNAPSVISPVSESAPGSEQVKGLMTTHGQYRRYSGRRLHTHCRPPPQKAPERSGAFLCVRAPAQHTRAQASGPVRPMGAGCHAPGRTRSSRPPRVRCLLRGSGSA